MRARNNTGYNFNGVPKGEIGEYTEDEVRVFKLEPVNEEPKAPSPAPQDSPTLHPKTAGAIARAETAGDLQKYLEDTDRPHVVAAAEERLQELAANDPDA